MAQDELHPTDMTQEEGELGFAVACTENPEAHLLGKAPTIAAVVHQVDGHNRIVKTAMPDGQIRYSHQRFGRWAHESSDVADRWLPCGSPYFAPQQAVDAATHPADAPCDPRIVSPPS